MTVVCRAIGCPQNNDGFCCAETILINANGNCFDLLRGFNPMNEPAIRKESSEKINFIDEPEEESTTDKTEEQNIEEEKKEDDSV